MLYNILNFNKKYTINYDMRKTKPDELKRKTITVSIDPRVYEMWVKYCEKYEIENYSEYFEKIIVNKLKEK